MKWYWWALIGLVAALVIYLGIVALPYIVDGGI